MNEIIERLYESDAVGEPDQKEEILNKAFLLMMEKIEKNQISSDMAIDVALFILTQSFELMNWTISEAEHFYDVLLGIKKNLPLEWMKVDALTDICMKTGNYLRGMQFISDFLDDHQSDYENDESFRIRALNREALLLNKLGCMEDCINILTLATNLCESVEDYKPLRVVVQNNLSALEEEL